MTNGLTTRIRRYLTNRRAAKSRDRHANMLRWGWR